MIRPIRVQGNPSKSNPIHRIMIRLSQSTVSKEFDRVIDTKKVKGPVHINLFNENESGKWKVESEK